MKVSKIISRQNSGCKYFLLLYRTVKKIRSTHTANSISRYLLAIGMGALAAVALSLSLAIVWIPSSVSTILQFRSGVIESLRDPYFQKYRVARKSNMQFSGSGTTKCSLLCS